MNKKFKKGDLVKYGTVVKGYSPAYGTGRFIRYNGCTSKLAYVEVHGARNTYAGLTHEVCCYTNEIKLLKQQLMFDFMYTKER